MTAFDLRELKEIIQSSNINFLIGAGASNPYLPLLGNIEKTIEGANGDKAKILAELRKYFTGVMAPCSNILDNGASVSDTRPEGADPKEPTDKQRFEATAAAYERFFEAINCILLKRKSTLLSKQANVFTTNIDVFMEAALEGMNIEYNDGFKGNINPIFQTSNFYKSVFKTSAHFSNVSEIPTFNIVKLHGSLSWKVNNTKDKIVYSKLEAIDIIKACEDHDDNFTEEYEKLQIVNPTKDKFRETVMGVTHYELLRMYSSELEKENTVLFVIGFSMADEHIREITLRAANSNPTLKVYIFCYSSGSTEENCRNWFSSMKYKNIEIVIPDGDKRHNLDTVTADFMEAIFHDEYQSQEDPSGDESTGESQQESAEHER